VYSDAMRQIVNDRGEQLRRSAERTRRPRRRTSMKRLHTLAAVIARH
jgi:hypothetical protein